MKNFVLFLLLVAVLSCKRTSKYPYTIKDFNESLQPYLEEVVSNGVVEHDTATRYIQVHATDKELTQLSHSEHPVLRAVAFRAMLERTTFDHFALIMNNLDDTAIVPVDWGEWGIRYFRVSDDLLQHGKWKDSVAKKRTIAEVILHHNYLTSAYRGLTYVDNKEEYYPIIKEMTQREIYNSNVIVKYIHFEDFETALYKIAEYKRKNDIPIIKDFLLTSRPQLTERSFSLMRNFPDPEYFEVFRRYYPRQFYRVICQDHHAYTAVAFINALATFKNAESARILDSILNKRPLLPCLEDSSYIRSELITAVGNNPSDAYSKLRKQTEAEWKRYNAIDTSKFVAPITIDEPKDRLAEPVGWW